MNILVDTNVLLSAALRDRLPEKVVLHVATADAYRWIVTAEIIKEYIEVLQRPKFGLTPEILRQWAALLEMRTVIVPSPHYEVSFPRDPKDAPFLSAALAAGADILVTGDNDLLQAKAILPFRVLTVAEFAIEFNVL